MASTHVGRNQKRWPKGNELLGKESQEEGRRGILGRQRFAQPSRSKRTYSEATLLSASSGPWTPGQLPGLMGRVLLLTEQGHGPVQPEAVQKVRVSPYASAADAPVSLHYFFRFSFMSFLFFISLFFFNFLFCLGSCLASNFLFLSLFRLTIEAFCPALFKTSFHSSSSPRIMY